MTRLYDELTPRFWQKSGGASIRDRYASNRNFSLFNIAGSVSLYDKDKVHVFPPEGTPHA